MGTLDGQIGRRRLLLADPLIDLRLFRVPVFSASLVTSPSASSLLLALFFLSPDTCGRCWSSYEK
jgi:hypothetical protein